MVPIEELLGMIGRAIRAQFPGLADRRNRTRLGRVLAGLVAGIGAVVVTATVALRELHAHVQYWQVAAGVVGFVVVTVGQAWLEDSMGPRPAPRKERVHELTAALEQATDLVEELRREISEGEQLAERYQADIARFEKLRELKRDEVEAVAQQLRSELRSGEGRNIVVSLLTNAVVGALFFAWGLKIGH